MTDRIEDDERDDLHEEDVEDQDRDDDSPDDDKDVDKPRSDREWRKMERALRRANREAESLRKQVETANPKQVEETEQRAREEAVKESEARWKPIVVKQAARAALAEAGLLKSPDKLLRLLDMDDIDVNDDGEIDGLNEQIREFKKEFPEFFGRRTPKDVDGGDKGGRASQGKGSADLIARALTGGR